MKPVRTACALLLWSGALVAQSDSLPALPVISVQIPQDSAVLDTVWRDTVWTWSGRCPSERLSIRLTDRNSGQVAQRLLPCVPVPTASSPYVSEAPPAFAVELTLTRERIAAWAWSNDAACFPPLSPSALDAVDAEWDALIFERDQLEAILAWAADRCLSPATVRRCVERLGSEARRLALLEGLAQRCSDPGAIDMTGLFILRTTREAALRAVEK